MATSQEVEQLRNLFLELERRILALEVSSQQRVSTFTATGNLVTNLAHDTGAVAVQVDSTQTTKGDLMGYSTTPARLAVGSNGQVLVADSAETTGLKWITYAASSSPSAPYPVTATDRFLFVDAASGAVTITLPTAATGKFPLTVKKIDASVNAVVVQRSGSDTLDGAVTSVSLGTQYEVRTFTPNGVTSWWTT